MYLESCCAKQITAVVAVTPELWLIATLEVIVSIIMPRVQA